MKGKTFNEILASQNLTFPIVRNRKESYKSTFDRIAQSVFLEIQKHKLLNEVGLRKFHDIISGISNTLDLYLNGNVYESTSSLRKVLEEHNPFLTTTISSNSVHFRSRYIESINFDKEDLFHIPFDKRGIIKTQRYSISGYPTLYLGSSVYVVWHEMGKPNLDHLSFASFEFCSSLNYVDLTYDRYLNNEIADININTIINFPLILACSFKVQDEQNHFKIEYIISQMIMQYVKTNPNIYGVKFNSTKTSNSHTGKPIGYNLAIPVHSNKETGLCEALCNYLSVSEPVNYPEFILLNQGSYMKEHDKEVTKIDEIELVKGVKTHYSTTKLGKIEEFLIRMEKENISEKK
jgi:hypothetical protein